VLVLVRKPGRKIMIGDNIVITIVDIGPGRCVKVGINAPIELAVHREEVYERIQRGETRDAKAFS